MGEREFYDDSNTGYYKEKFKHAKKKEKKTQNYDDHLDISFYKNFLMKDNMDLYGKTLEDMKTFLLKKSDTKIEPELLYKIFNKKYPHSLNLEVDEEEIINFSRYFLKDERLKKDFYDTENNSSQYEKAFKEIQSKQEKYEKKNQISFYNLFPIQEDILPVFEGDYCEQRMIYQLCHFVTGTELEEKDDPCFHFLYKIFKGIDSFDPFQKRKFESGIFVENEKDLKEEYREKNSRVCRFKVIYRKIR